jgi:hypothetical protein
MKKKPSWQRMILPLSLGLGITVSASIALVKITDSFKNFCLFQCSVNNGAQTHSTQQINNTILGPSESTITVNSAVSSVVNNIIKSSPPNSTMGPYLPSTDLSSHISQTFSQPAQENKSSVYSSSTSTKYVSERYEPPISNPRKDDSPRWINVLEILFTSKQDNSSPHPPDLEKYGQTETMPEPPAEVFSLVLAIGVGVLISRVGTDN